MANKAHLSTLKQGVDAWNAWRKENPEVRADLSRAKLEGADLSGANLSTADLSRAKLEGADLSGAILSRIDFSRVNLSGARLVEMPLTDGHKAGIEIGVNGIWNSNNDSAALMTLTPPGNSMLAANPDAVIESLKRARRLHSLSFGLAVLALGLLFLKLEEIVIPFLGDLPVPTEKYTLLALIVSACVLTLVKSYMDDALNGARYLQDRQSAMAVGTFSWALSRYTGDQLIKQIQSLVTRLVMAFHPVVYVFLLPEPLDWYYWALGAVLLVFSTWIFVISQQFQRPILFDRATEKAEEDRKSDTQELTAAVEKQTDKLTELIDLLKPETAEPEAEPPSEEDTT